MYKKMEFSKAKRHNESFIQITVALLCLQKKPLMIFYNKDDNHLAKKLHFKLPNFPFHRQKYTRPNNEQTVTTAGKDYHFNP